MTLNSPPAAKASAVPTPKAAQCTGVTPMPTMRAAMRFCATAFIALPSRVRLTKSESRPSRTMAATSITTLAVDTWKSNAPMTESE